MKQAMICLLAVLCALSGEAQQQIWLAPAPAAPDTAQLTDPQGWISAREVVARVKVYQQQALERPCPTCGPNVLTTLRASGFFAEMEEPLALEVSVVKEWNCTNWSGESQAIHNALDSIENVEGSGGRVAWFMMDEPFVSGRSPCGQSIADTSTQIALWWYAVRAERRVRLGLIEAFPYLSTQEIGAALDWLRLQGVPVERLHLDVDFPRLEREGRVRELAPALRALREYCAKHDVRFGILLWGRAESYPADVLRLTELVRSSGVVFDDIVFQSWAGATPPNLPEDKPGTHTWLIHAGLACLRGEGSCTPP